MLDYEQFKEEIQSLANVDLNLYKEKQMKRRINTLIGRLNYSGYEEYVQVLKSDPEKLEYFLDYITINVTEFFRTPDHWTYLHEEIFSSLNDKTREYKLWSTACSTGEEAYSLAIALAEHMSLSNIHIIATDINSNVLQIAKRGIYPSNSLEAVDETTKEKYFIKEGNQYKVIDEIKSCIEFKKMDLLQDEFFMDCDLIACRNVLIYFTEDAKKMLFHKFWLSLKDNGYLFTGNTEQIINAKQIHYMKVKPFLYQKKEK